VTEGLLQGRDRVLGPTLDSSVEWNERASVSLGLSSMARRTSCVAASRSQSRSSFIQPRTRMLGTGPGSHVELDHAKRISMSVK
jgi:hypothetical protein